MKYTNVAAIICLLFATPLLQAEPVTVHGSMGRLEAPLMTKTLDQVGVVKVWNDTKDLNLEVTSGENYILSKVYVYLDKEPAPDPSLRTEPDFGEWPYNAKYKKEVETTYSLTLNFEEDLDFKWGQWGEPWLENRVLTIAVCVELTSLDVVPVNITAWALNTHPDVGLAMQETGWGDNAYAMRYEVQHPKHGNFFLDGPVNGLGYATQTQAGLTGIEGGFWFFPGETILLYLGETEIGFAETDQRLSPLDIFVSSDNTVGSPAVNMARLLKSMDTEPGSHGSIEISAAIPYLESAMSELSMNPIDFMDTGGVEALIGKMIELALADGLVLEPASLEDTIVALEQAAGSALVRRNISRSPEYATDKPKLDIMPLWVPARRADGTATTVTYRDEDGEILEERGMVKPLFVTYTEEQDPNLEKGITRRGCDIITAVSQDDGETWKRFNVSHMAKMSSFENPLTEEKFPGDSRGPRQSIEGNNILVVWTSAYARGGKPSFAIKTDDDYPYDDAYAVNDVWGVRGKQGHVNYDEDDAVANEGIGIIPYYALWACRGVVDKTTGDITWFKPERLTSGRRDAFFAVSSGAKGAGFAIAWQEDPGGLRPGNCKGGGHGWSGATVHKKTDIWYSYISLSNFGLIDENFDPADHSADDHGEDDHGKQPELANRPKWLVPFSLPVRVSDNSTVNTENLKVELDETTGLPKIDPETGSYIPLYGAEEADWVASEHETEGGCGGEDDGDHTDHDGHNGTGGGWGMARYAYEMPELGIVDFSCSTDIWDATVSGEYRPTQGIRWYRFVNKPGAIKTVAVTDDGRVLDGDTGACRPFLKLVPSGKKGGAWAILGYEETKGLGTPPEGDHEEEDEHLDRPEPDDWGKNIIYHSFPFNQPDLVSAGDVLNLPALDDDGNLIPIFYKDANGEPTEFFRQYKTENARRVRCITQPLKSMNQVTEADTIMVALYKQGREGQGKPSDIFSVRCVVPQGELFNYSVNPFRFDNLERLDTSVPNPDANGHPRYMRQHQNLTSSQVLAMDPVEIAMDDEGHSWNKVGKWKQHQGNLSDESFANPYSEAKGHRGFIRGDKIVIGYSLTPNWGRRGGDHLDFYIRRSFDGGRTWTTDPSGNGAVHTVIERDPNTGDYKQVQYQYGPGEFEPGRNVSLLKGNSHTVIDPRLVPPMGSGATLNPYYYPEDDIDDPDTFIVAFGTAKVLRAMGDPLGAEEMEAEDIFYTRTTDSGETWLMVPWEINPDSASPDAGETVYRWPWLAQGTPHQGHAQLRMHPSGTRFYAIWHQWADGDEQHLSPHDMGDDIWFRRIDFMAADE